MNETPFPYSRYSPTAIGADVDAREHYVRVCMRVGTKREWANIDIPYPPYWASHMEAAIEHMLKAVRGYPVARRLMGKSDSP